MELPLLCLCRSRLSGTTAPEEAVERSLSSERCFVDPENE